MQRFSILFLVTLVLFISACKGQISDTSQIKNLKSNSSEIADTKKPWVDPQFFIDGQLCQHLRNIYQTSDGDLWFGTNIYGLMHFDGDTLVYYNDKSGPNFGRITGFAEDEEGNLWFSHYNGIAKYDGKKFTFYGVNEGLIEPESWSILIDKEGIIWVGTTEGAFQFDGIKFTYFDIPKAVVQDTNDVYSYNRITHIIQDVSGNILFGTDGFGISVYDGNDFTHITNETGLANNAIARLFEDSKGNIWIGTNFGGISKMSGTTISNYTKDGLVDGVEVSDIFEDSKGNIWFGVENYGVYKYDGTDFTNFYKEVNLVTNTILAIREDKQGRFWFGGWGGLFRFDGKTFTPVTKDGPFH